MPRVDTPRVNIGPPAAARATCDRAADDRIADREAADLDPFDLLVIRSDLRPKSAIESGSADLDMADAADLVVGKIEHDIGYSRLSRGLFPSRFWNCQGGVAQEHALAGAAAHQDASDRTCHFYFPGAGRLSGDT